MPISAAYRNMKARPNAVCTIWNKKADTSMPGKKLVLKKW